MQLFQDLLQVEQLAGVYDLEPVYQGTNCTMRSDQANQACMLYDLHFSCADDTQTECTVFPLHKVLKIQTIQVFLDSS